MTLRPAEAPMEVDFPDGGRLIVTFADDGARYGDGANDIATALIRVDGSESELERAVVDEAGRHGLRCSVSGSRHPTTVVVESASIEQAGTTREG
jgi:hypothetical protein